MTYLLNVLYLILLVLAVPWLLIQSIRKGKYRAGWGAKFLGRVPKSVGPGPVVWLHAVSVGEVNLLQPIIAQLEERFPDVECVISSTTNTGLELARQRFGPRSVFYCPLDFSWAVKSALRRINPSVLVLVELELWPNLIRLASRRGTSVVIVNGRLSENSFAGYMKVRPLIANIMKSLGLVAAQSETYAQRFLKLGAPEQRVHVTGSIKFDGSAVSRDNDSTTRLRELSSVEAEDLVFVAGNTQPEENTAAISVYQNLKEQFPKLRLIIVPRHPETFDDVAKELEASGISFVRRTEMDELAATGKPVVLVDVIGELRDWWGLADTAFVGGSWGTRGGQNMIEPAAYGAAVSFGSNTSNFRDVVALLQQNQACVIVDNEAEMSDFVKRCFADPTWAGELGSRARETVMSQQGATQATIDLVGPLLSPTVTSDSSDTH